MNERIKQLAEQAWTMVSDEERERNELYEADTQRERRDQVFAELIVKECANRLAEDFIPEDEIIEGYDDTWDSALRFGAQAIKEHFGVEEK